MSAAANAVAISLMLIPEPSSFQDLTKGLAIARMLGSCNLYVNGLVVGDPNIHVWIGLAVVEADNASTPQPMPSISDWNDERWLWRQPLPVFTNSYSDSLNALMTSHTWDWPIRGGKGSTMKQSQSLRLIVQVNPSVDAGIIVIFDYELLMLWLPKT